MDACTAMLLSAMPLCGIAELDYRQNWPEAIEASKNLSPHPQLQFWDYSGWGYHYGPNGLSYHRHGLNPPRPGASPLP